MRPNILFLLLAGSIGMSSQVVGQGFILPRNNIEAPRLTAHTLKGSITNQAAGIQVQQVFKNEGSVPVEGVYYFPVPKEAVVSNFAMWVDGKKLAGELLNKEEARKIYEDIVRRNIDPALLEYADHSFFRINIFPIPPGKERKIELSYSQLLTMQDGLVSFHYPLHGDSKLGMAQSNPVMPMPAHRTLRPSSEQEEDEGAISKPSNAGCSQTFTLDIKSDIPIKNVYSPSHEVEIVRHSDHDVQVSYEGERHADEGDLLLYYSLSPEDLGLNLLCHKPDNKDGFFLLLISPSAEPMEQKILDKDVVFVLDVSGSMAGEKITQAKSALENGLKTLRPNDRFALLTFSSEVQSFRESLASGELAKHKALEFVRDLNAKGGTNLDAALKGALSFKGDALRPLNVVFLTDGLPTVGVTDIGTILANMRNQGSKARVFTFGIGYDVNTYLLDKIADESHAISDYIVPKENIAEKVSAFFDKISRPVLADLSLDINRITVADVYPKQMPDLFQGNQLMVMGRYKNSGRTTVTLKGKTNEATADYSYGCEFSGSAQNDFLPRLWASRKIAYLVDAMRTNGESEEVRKEIEELSKEYGIMTPYTSYLVREDSMPMLSRQTFGVLPPEKGEVSFLRLSVGSRQSVPLAYDASSSVGQSAVEMSKDLHKLKSAEQATGVSQPDARYIAGKTFYLRNGEWVDHSYKDEITVEIKYGSSAFLNLLASYPELGKFMTLGKSMVIGLRGKFIRIGDKGIEDKNQEELRKIFG